MISIRSIVLLVMLFGISLTVSYILNKEQIDLATSEIKVITSDTFAGVESISKGDVIKLIGTPDRLNAISLEDRNSGAAFKYYVPLKEYGINFVVETSKIKLKNEEQSFIGVITGINDTEFESRIRNALNKPVELTDEDRLELDADTIAMLTEETTNQFTSKTLLLIDDELPNINNVYTYVVFWAAIIWAAAANMFRKSIFGK